MSEHEQGQPGEPDEVRLQRVQDEAARLGLAVIGEATAMTTGDESLVEAGEANLLDAVAELTDEPFTERQVEIVETLGAMSGSITAGLGSALAHAQGREPEAVLGGAAASIVWQQRLASGEMGSGEKSPDAMDQDGMADADQPDRDHGEHRDDEA